MTTLILFVSMAIILAGPIQKEKLVDIENQLQRHKGGRIVLVVNSNGGSVDVGHQIMDRLKATKKPIDCIVTQEAASMAFTLLTVCDNRYALHSSFFLTHDIRMQYTFVQLTEKELERDLEDLKKSNEQQRDIIRKSLGIYREGTWTGVSLQKEFPQWIKLIDNITWIGERK